MRKQSTEPKGRVTDRVGKGTAAAAVAAAAGGAAAAAAAASAAATAEICGWAAAGKNLDFSGAFFAFLHASSFLERFQTFWNVFGRCGAFLALAFPYHFLLLPFGSAEW